MVSSTEKMNISLSAFAPENLVSRDGFGSPVPRQPAHLHTQAESGAYLRDSSRVSRRSPFIYYRRTKNDREYSTSTCFFFFILFVRIRKSKWNQTDNLFIFFCEAFKLFCKGQQREIKDLRYALMKDAKLTHCSCSFCCRFHITSSTDRPTSHP